MYNFFVCNICFIWLKESKMCIYEKGEINANHNKPSFVGKLRRIYSHVPRLVISSTVFSSWRIRISELANGRMAIEQLFGSVHSFNHIRMEKIAEKIASVNKV
jgi:hypothetical protein